MSLRAITPVRAVLILQRISGFMSETFPSSRESIRINLLVSQATAESVYLKGSKFKERENNYAYRDDRNKQAPAGHNKKIRCAL